MTTQTRASSPGGNGQGTVVEYGRYIEMQLRKTRSQVRNVDIAGELMVLSAGTLAYFLAVALVDHWVLSGGMGVVARSLCLAVFVAGAGYYFVKQIAPLLLRRINPVYAAHTIENSKPSLKNSLVNFLLFRQHPEELPSVIYQAIEEQAATNLAKVPLDSAVDRSKLIKIGYVLLGVLLACAIYKVASPKDPFRTVSRVVMPWADIQPPTRVAILDVQPGNTTEFTGQRVTVSAEVSGVRDSETVRVLYTSADGQTVDKAVDMRVPDGGYRYTAVLPADDAMLEQDLKYRIEAGDASSREYDVTVVDAPTIVVESVEYRYPEYTGLYPRRVEHQGDIKAIEGTEITVHALANQEIQSAYVDFDCDDHPDVHMSVAGRHASAKFVLGVKKDRTPEHASYQLLYKNAAGQNGVRPLHYQIEVTPDLPPLIEFVGPAKDELELPADRAIPLEVEAQDPDFALHGVRLIALRGDKPLVDKQLLDKDKEWRGKFQGRLSFDPRKLALKSGDVIEYWAVAEDNKSPQPNRTETAKRHITIVSPGSEKPQPDQLAQANEKDANDKDTAGGKEHDRSDEGEERPQKSDERNPHADKNDHGSDSGESKDGGAGEKGKPDNKQEQGDASQQKNDQAGDNSNGSQEKQPGGKDAQGSEEGGSDTQKDNRQDGENGKSGAAGADKDSAKDSAEGGKNGDGKQNQPVAKDGTDDGGAFDRVLKQLQKEDANQSGGQDQGEKKDQQGKSKPSNDPQQQEDNEGAKGDDGGGQSPGGEQGGSGGGGKAGGSGGPQGAGGQSGKPQNGGQQNGGEKNGGQQGGQKSDAAGQKGSGGAGGSPSQPDQNENPSSGDSDDAGEKGQGTGDSGQDGPAKSGGADRGQQSNGGGKPDGNGQGSSGKDDQHSPDAQGSKGQGKERRADKPLKHEKSDRAGGEGGAESSERDPDAPQFKPDRTKQGQPSGTKPPGKSPSPADGQKHDKQGQGDDAQGGAGAAKKPSNEQKPGDTGGDPDHQKGDSGAGQSGKGDAKSPASQGANQPRKKKTPHEDSPEPNQSEESQSPGTSPKESDSEGDSGGDRPGGGRRGAGQKANKPGTGGPGQNTAAKEGAGQSPESGDGNSTNEAGGDETSDHPTGTAGSEKGDGSTSKAGSGRAGGQSSKPGDSKDQTVENTRRQQGKSGAPGQGQGGLGGGGSPGTSEGELQPTPPGEDPKAEQANLEYARKATDLALERLKHQLDKNQVDQKLLDSLGWSRDDLEQFVRRWEAMRREARQKGPQGQTAKKELDEALRSLGLRPHGTTLKSDSSRDDQEHGLKESLRTRPPAEYAEPYKRYIQGTARGGN